MQTIPGTLHRDFSTDSFWTRVQFISDKADKKTEVFLCASYEYLSNDLNVQKIDDGAFEKWVSETVNDIKKEGDVLFNKDTHLVVRAITPDGYTNGVSFLEDMLAQRDI